MHSERQHRGRISAISGNMPFVSLFPSGRLALWGLRYWAACARQGRCPALMLRDVYASAGVPHAPVSIDRMMQVLALSGDAGPRFGCPACSRLTDDEADILNAMLRAQGGDPSAVVPVVGNWLPSLQAIAMAGDAMAGYARLLLAGGYDLTSGKVPALDKPPLGARLH